MSPLDLLDLELLVHPRETTTDVILVWMDLILEQTDVLYVDPVVGELDLPSVQGLHPLLAALANQTYPVNLAHPEDTFMDLCQFIGWKLKAL